MLDLAIVSAELRIGLASAAEADVARRDALELLDLASALCGPGPRLDRLRETVGARPPPDLAAKHDQVNLSVLDHYDLGRSDLRAGRFREAALEFQRVLAERPQDFWPNFYEGLCAYRLKQFHEAEAAFRACIALAPGSAECYFNRGRAAEALGRDDQALRDYSRALELDPALTSAAINRGILAYKNDRHDAAIADFHEALRWTSASRARGLIHYNLALAHLAKGDRELALASARESLTRGHEPAQALIDRLRRLP
jgi:Flp pilus assembly protein TadD